MQPFIFFLIPKKVSPKINLKLIQNQTIHIWQFFKISQSDQHFGGFYSKKCQTSLQIYKLDGPENVPKWLEILPGASGLWNMIETLRERGNVDLATSLELAAHKQVQGHQLNMAVFFLVYLVKSDLSSVCFTR